jgi:hypothetical protein
MHSQVWQHTPTKTLKSRATLTRRPHWPAAHIVALITCSKQLLLAICG